MSSNLLHLRRAVVQSLQAAGLNRAASDLYYRFFHGFRSASPGLDEGFEAIFEAVARLGSLRDADYAEFGLFKGYSFSLAQQLADRHGLYPRCYGFDSFEGLPEVFGLDETAHGEFRKGQFACSMDAVRENLTRAGIDWSRTHLVQGYFEDSLSEELAQTLGIRRIGVAMIDCDLYSSTVTVLDWLRPRIGEGSVLIMDDWNCFGGAEDRGQRRAMAEFLERERTFSLEPLARYGANSEAFILHEAGAARN